MKWIDTESDELLVIYVFSKEYDVKFADVFEIDAERLLRWFKNGSDIYFELLLRFVLFL